MSGGFRPLDERPAAVRRVHYGRGMDAPAHRPLTATITAVAAYGSSAGILAFLAARADWAAEGTATTAAYIGVFAAVTAAPRIILAQLARRTERNAGGLALAGIAIALALDAWTIGGYQTSDSGNAAIDLLSLPFDGALGLGAFFVGGALLSAAHRRDAA